ncbi:MAG: ADOP family duplicated permease [Acidobacteriaceae bacterium]
MALLSDIRQVAGRLWRDRKPATWAVLMLALGIGSTAAVFGIVNAILLQPLPYKNPGRLVVLWQKDIRSNQDIIPWGNFLDYQRERGIFDGVGAFAYWTPVLVNKKDREPIVGAGCTSNLFELLGISPLLGRAFLPQEQGHGVNHVVILSYGLWQRAFDSDAHIIGKHVFFKEKIDAWTPIGLDLVDASRRGNQVYALGLLRSKVTLNAAQRGLAQVADQLAQEFPETNRGVGVELVPLAAQLVHNVRPLILTLSAAVGFILLLSCASVAGIILAHAIRGSHESALRAALGAKARDLMRPPLIEGLLLATLGGLLGLGIARTTLAMVVAQTPADLLGPRLVNARVDGTVLIFGLSLALLCGIGSGLVAALRSCRLPLSETLKQGGQSTSAGGNSLGLQRLFLVLQISAAFVLLVGTGLMIRSFLRLDREKLGFEPKDLLTFNISLPNSLAEGDREVPVLNQFLGQVEALPGVRSAALVDSFPLSDYPYMFRVEGSDSDWRPADFHTVSPDWFHTLGLRIIAGRTFTATDDGHAQRVMVVNQEMVRRFWPGRSPIGKTITVRPSRWHPAPQYTVVGEISDTRPFGGGSPSPAMFVPFAQFAEPMASVVVRTNVSPESLIHPVRSVALATNTDSVADEFSTAETYLEQSTQKPHFAAKILGALAIIALMVATVGTYSVVSLLFRLQLRSVGIRLALGARRSDIIGWFLRASGRVALVGIACGLVGSLLFDKLISSLLYGLSAIDPIALAGAALVVLSASLLISLPTALNASNVKPSRVLKEE